MIEFKPRPGMQGAQLETLKARDQRPIASGIVLFVLFGTARIHAARKED
jgi:hypothetical protein